MTVNKFAVGSIVFAAAMVASGAASAAGITLNTTGLKANSVLTFTPAAYGSATSAGISFRPVGNMSRLADASVMDPETEMEVQVPVFNQPVTKAVITIGWDLKITPLSGAATRSGLQIIRKVGTSVNWAALANFNLDFVAKKVYADIITASGTTANTPIYDFKDDGNLKISFKGLVLNQTQSVSNLIFTPSTQDALASALKLSAPLKATLGTTDWGTIAVQVTSYKRTPKLSDVPLTAADIPAP